MKKTLILGLSILLTLGTASISMANTFSVDITTGGTIETALTSDNLTETVLGFDMPLNDAVNLSCNLGFGNSDSVDTTRILAKGECMLVTDPRVNIAITGGYYNRDFDYSNYTNSYSLHSLFLGFDAQFKIDHAAWINFDYGYGLNPTYADTDIDSLSLLNCKFNYQFSREIGASLGYFGEWADDVTCSGITIGGFYRF